ncbi:MAG: cation-translocating P-type ATPase [Actinomycetia bacterium]|nr:cation-translocating P-type ATPase [Actinomycetes bacterium]
MSSGEAASDDDVIDMGGERFWRNREVQWSAASGILLVVGFVSGLSGAGILSTWVFVVATVVGARFFAAEAIELLVEDRVVGIELLMTVAALTAGVLGLWGEAATLAFLYSISEALEEFTEDRTRHAIRALMDLAPKRATRLIPGGGEEVIDVDQLRVDDRFLVRPGQAVATDGTVEDGESAIDESSVTGEPIPVEKVPGDQVFAGTLNTSGALVVAATATSADNTLARIVHLVTEAQEQKGHSERRMRKFSRRYSPAVLAGGALVALVGGIVTGDWSTWMLRAATVLVAAAPCALVISIPVTYVAAMGNAGRHGVLIKGGVHLESLAVVRVLALDKTGTLTRGKPKVVEVLPLNKFTEDRIVSIAAAVESRSEHPLARAVCDYSQEAGVDPPPITKFRSLVGAGAEATIEGIRYTVGSPSLAANNGVNLDAASATIASLQDRGLTVIVVADPDRALGLLGIADVIRENARDAIQQLHSLGIEQLVMLTGDNQRTAAAVATEVGVDAYDAELRPEEKSTAVRALGETHGHVGMVGDGVNDAPALAAADVGIAMGAAGSDVALETADVVLMADDLTRLVDAVRIGRRTRRVVRQNLALSFVILIVLIPGALVGWLALPAAVLAHELSEFAVIANGMRMAR